MRPPIATLAPRLNIGFLILTNEVRFVYDGSVVLQERDANNVPVATYTRGLDLSGSLAGAGGIGGLLAHSLGCSAGNWTTNFYYHADGNGNVTCLLSTNQTMVGIYQYDPYGFLLASQGPQADTNYCRFSSKEFHPNSGLYYFGFRYYDPNLQRFINQDPIREAGGINMHGHAGNDPVNLIDPYGLKWLLFDSEAWGQLISDTGVPQYVGQKIHKTFVGNPCPKRDLMKHSNLALRSQEGAGIGKFKGSNGEEVSGSEVMLDLGLGLWGSAVTIATVLSMAAEGAVMGEGARLFARGSTIAKTAEQLEFQFAPQIEQYALRAKQSGFYPVMVRGSENSQFITYLEKGDVWKFGTTVNPGIRYSSTYLKSIGEHGVKYSTEFLGTEQQAIQLQNMKILNYRLQNGRLPPGNKVVN